MRGIYLADYFEGSGFGHVTRYLSYSTMLEQFDIDLATQEKFNNRLKSNILIPSDNNKFVEMINAYDFVICDSFVLDDTKISRLQNMKKVIFIDDFVRRHYESGLIIDSTVTCEEYLRPTGSKSLYGLDYSLVRREFYDHNLSDIKADIPLTCIFGGHDPRDYMTLFYDELSKDTIFVGTSAYPSYERYKRAERIYWDLDVACLAKIFARSKFVLSTAGQTLYELAAMNKAFCSIVFTENQKKMV